MQCLKFLGKIQKKKFLILSLATVFLTAVLLSLFSFFSKQSEAPYVNYPPQGEYVRGEVIVSFREGYEPHVWESGKSEIDKKLKEIGIKDFKRQYEGNDEKLDNFYILYYNSEIKIEQIQEKLKNLPFLQSAEPNSMMQILVTPNDPSYPQLWGMEQIQAPQAWDTTTGSKSIVVADIDTGVDYTHPDLSANIAGTGRDFSTCNTYSSGSCVQPKTCPQSAEEYCDDDAMDDHGHGTHVAGTIGAVGNNSIGVAGVNWNVKILPIKVMNRQGSGDLNGPMDGLKYAADQGVEVANLSLGGNRSCTGTQQAAVNYAISKGVVVVVAAGNDSRDAASQSPAGCNGVITVGATTASDSRASFSNFGNVVEIAAPGVGIVSTYLGGYKSAQGTSMAAPHVTGAVALLLSAKPNLSPAEVSQCLINSGDIINTDKPIGPRLNIANAIRDCQKGSDPVATSAVTSGPTTSVAPTIPSGSIIYKISGYAFSDTNKNGNKESGEPGRAGVSVSVTGVFGTSFIKGTSTGSDGYYEFVAGLKAGTYNLVFNNAGQVLPWAYAIILSPSNPVEQIDIDVSTNTPIGVTPQPTSPPNFTPTVTPSVTVTLTPAPTSTSNPLTPAPTSANPPGSGDPGGGSGGEVEIPPVPYNCVIDPRCTPQQKNLQLCQLICTPI